jgi:osmotically-inducible protein OsmY
MKLLKLAWTSVLAVAVYAGAQIPGQQPGMGQPGAGGTRPGLPGMGEPGMGGNGQPNPTNPNPNMSQPKVDDQTLDRQVHEQLRTQAELSHVQPRVEKGVVYLEGTVPDKKSRKQAEKLVHSIPGVQGVKDNLKIQPTTTSQLIGTDNQPSAGSIAGNTQAEAGTTIAEGRGGSAAENPGLQGAMPQSDSTQPSTNTAGSDSGAISSTELETKLNNSLWNDPSLSGASLSATVTATTVDVEGSVRNGKQKEDALRLAHSYASNRKVVDHVTIASATAVGTPSPLTPSGNAGAPSNTNSSPGAAQTGTTGTGATSGAGSAPQQ